MIGLTALFDLLISLASLYTRFNCASDLQVKAKHWPSKELSDRAEEDLKQPLIKQIKVLVYV